MAPDNNDSISTRERLEFLLDNDRSMAAQSESYTTASRSVQSAASGTTPRNAFLAGVAFSGLLASSIFLTHYIDGRLQPSATEGSSASTSKVGAVAATGTAGAQAPAVLAAATIPTPVAPPAHVTTRTPPPGFVTPLTPPQDNKPLTKIPGLSTSRSVITGVADPQTLTASCYWTFTLKNTSRSNQEAQMNLTLPDGAVVSRATLWINGKAQEAAFNSTESVQNAYDWIVTLNRDPLLIKQTDANHIKIKASPVVPNKEMKIRIGMTVPLTMSADGTTQMNMPHISEANLDTSCIQNVHITSDAPLFASDAHMNSAPQKTGYLLRGNLSSADLSNLQVTMTRNAQLTRFATRATHSFPPSFVVAELQPDSQGVNKLTLTKTESKPDCQIITDDHAAFRLSYLWAKEEIDRLVQDGDRSQAVELATVYRVVSPVSGAVVLERNSDYDYNGLDRNLYRSMSYRARDKQQRLVEEKSTNNFADAEYETDKTPMPSTGPTASTFTDTSRATVAMDDSLRPPMSSPAPAPRADQPFLQEPSKAASFHIAHAKRRSSANSESLSMLQNKLETRSVASVPKQELAQKAASKGPLKKTLASLQTKTSGTRLEPSRVNGLEAQTEETAPNAVLTSPRAMDTPTERLVKLAGPVANWLQHNSALNENTTLATALLLGCIGLTFAGGLGLVAAAAVRATQRKQGAFQLAAAGSTWLILAAWWPLFSQVTFVVFGLAFLAQTAWNGASRLTSSLKASEAPDSVRSLQAR